jgi:hypothetical protein
MLSLSRKSQRWSQGRAPCQCATALACGRPAGPLQRQLEHCDLKMEPERDHDPPGLLLCFFKFNAAVNPRLPKLLTSLRMITVVTVTRTVIMIMLVEHLECYGESSVIASGWRKYSHLSWLMNPSANQAQDYQGFIIWGYLDYMKSSDYLMSIRNYLTYIWLLCDEKSIWLFDNYLMIIWSLLFDIIWFLDYLM